MTSAASPDWDEIRRQFKLDPTITNFALMAIASNPKPVRRAIVRAHCGLNRNPLQFAVDNNPTNVTNVLDLVSRYFGLPPQLIAFTQSTTMALGQLLGGLCIRRGDEVLASENEHMATMEALRLRERRDGTPHRTVRLFRDSASFTTEEILTNLRAAVRPSTRVLALAWVYSSDGVKLPLGDIADFVKLENSTRTSRQDRLLLVVDGVHGFGVEDATLDQLGCDLFAAGCHKWLFGPRGTAVMCGTRDGWQDVVPLLPGIAASPDELGTRHITAGLRAYEHFWALEQTFQFIMGIGKTAIAQRVHDLKARAHAGLARYAPRLAIHTPPSASQSSGIIAFDIDGWDASQIVDALRLRGFRLTESSWDAARGGVHARLAISILNSPNDIDRVVNEIGQLVASQPPG